MHTFDRLVRIVVVLALLLPFTAGGSSKTRRGDKYFAQGQMAEARKDWDKALELYEKALAEDPADPGYDMAVKHARFEAGAMHVKAGQKLQRAGDLDKALAEFQKAYAIDPSSDIAEQEIKRTLEMIDRVKKSEKKGAEIKPEERGLTPAELAKKEETAMLERLRAGGPA